MLKDFPKDSIDLVVTSPPYDDMRTYENKSNFNLESFQEIAKQLFRIVKPGGVVVWVIGDSSVKGSETGNSFRQALHFKKIGFRLHDTMIYKKKGVVFPSHTRYNQGFEYMFVFSKGRPKTFKPIQEANKEDRRSREKTERRKDGSLRRAFRQSKDSKSRMNIWTYSPGYFKTTKFKEAFKHPAMFPEELAHDHIISWSKKGDLVLLTKGDHLGKLGGTNAMKIIKVGSIV